jgi:RNA recognition motif-containing protein
MDENYLKESCRKYNIKVKNAKIIRDKNTHNSMGYGFLEFENRNQAVEALETLNGKPLPNSNKTFKLNWASYNTNKNNQQNPNEFSIYVCELSPSIKSDKLRDFFKEKYKSVFDAKIIIDPSTKISKGYGFVKFHDKAESERAINEMNGQIIEGKAMKTGNASYKKNEKKQNSGNNNNNNMNFQNDFTNLQNMQNDPNFLMNQQYFLQFCLANGYQPPNIPNLNMAYQMAQLSQMMNQNMPQQYQNAGNDIQGQDMNLLNNLALLQMMNNGGFGDMNAMMNNQDNNNQDSQ